MMEKHGHPEFYKLQEEDAHLHATKNHDYAFGGDPLGNFRRVADFLAFYPGFKVNSDVGVALTYAMKQLDATLWELSQGHTPNHEGMEKRLQDVVVYLTLARCMLRESRD